MKTKPTASGEPMVTLDVSLLGREYKVACKAGEEAELLDAVGFLDARMREVRENSKTSSTERIAVVTALNLAHDLRRGMAGATTDPELRDAAAVVDAPGARRRIASMRSAIDQALSGQEKLI